MGAPLLGCIADDFTGATDLANNLVRAGMRTVQAIGVPAAGTSIDADAVVVALKSRTIAPADAVAQSLEALRWLREAGCEQFYFKYCSTFDSTPAGNIGPVTDALLDALHGPGRGFTIVCPAFPENGRTIFRGHLFVGDVLLSDSGMRDHPLTPMTDSNLVRVMQAQTRRRVGLVAYDTVAAGPDAIRARFAALQGEGVGVAVVDAIGNADLMRLGEALAGMALVTAGSGVAIGLPRNWVERGRLAAGARADALPRAGGLAAVVSTRVAAGPVLVYATAAPDAVRAVQAKLGVAQAGELVERTLAAVARGLVATGVRRLVVAGGETSGAVVQALGVERMAIGPQIDPGVPWTTVESAACAGETVHLALKSGNFGTTDFFAKAFEQLRRA